MNKMTLCAAATAFSLFSASTAQAEPRTAEVTYADLDLQSDAGIARFDRRIEHAVEQVCDYSPAGSDRLFSRTVRLCKTETLANVQPARAKVLQAYRSGEVHVVAKLEIQSPQRSR